MSRLTSLAVTFALTAAALAGPSTTSPDGKLVARAEDRAITVSTGQPARVLMKIAGHRDEVTALAFSPDGKFLASVDKSGSTRLFDAATGKEVMQLAGPKGATEVSFSGDGKTLAVTTGKVAKKFDVVTGAEVK
jgi:WD40 repeat protein